MQATEATTPANATPAHRGRAASGRTLAGRPGQLWQLPLFVASLGLFGYAAYLFVDPGPRATIDQKITVARNYLEQDRPDAALEQLNKIIEIDQVDRDKEAEIHLLMAQALEDGQKQKKISIPVNYERIIEQTQLALAEGVKPTGDLYRRLGESYEALERDPEALQNYRMAMAMDPDHALHLQRKVIELQLVTEDWAGAGASIDDFLKDPTISESEKSWALGEKAQMLIDQDKFAEAKTFLLDALNPTLDPVDQGRFNYQLGYCIWKLGDGQTAERYLRLARDQLHPTHPLDADICYALGRIYEDRNDPETAASFYQVVLVSHPEADVAPLALLGRGLCRIMQNSDDGGLTDLHDLTNDMQRHAGTNRRRTEALDGLRQATELLIDHENYAGAIEVMSDEQDLEATLPVNFYGRLASVLEKRADQVQAGIADASNAEQIRRTAQVRDLRIKAGDAYIAYSRALTLADDKAYGDALWKGIDLYDQSGDMQSVIDALELFTAERPQDPLAPDAMLRLGQSYQAAGAFDKAIDTYQQTILRYPQSLAASKSAVPLAQALIAKGPDYYAQAEKSLLSVIEDNNVVTPEAAEFREALMGLSQLYYRTGRYEEAINRLTEMSDRYPNDDRQSQIDFLMADSYRKSAAALDTRVASTGATAAEVAEAVEARRDRLTKARQWYDKALALYLAAPPDDDLNKLYCKLSCFYRADCMYDLGNYEEAIKLYDNAAFRYQDDPSALAAYVQIVNAYCALGKPEEAKTANERAKWLLRRIPPEAFQNGTFSMPKEYWDQWLRWTSDSGMW